MPQIISYSTHNANSAWDPVKPHPATLTLSSANAHTTHATPPSSAATDSYNSHVAGTLAGVSQADRMLPSSCTSVVTEHCEVSYREECMEVFYVEHGRVYLLPHSALSIALAGAEATCMPHVRPCDTQPATQFEAAGHAIPFVCNDVYTPRGTMAVCQHVLTDASWEALLQAPGVRWRNEPYRSCTVASDRSTAETGTGYATPLPRCLAQTAARHRDAAAAVVATLPTSNDTLRGAASTALRSSQQAPQPQTTMSGQAPIQPGAGALYPSPRRVPGDYRCISYCLPPSTTAASSPRTAAHATTTSSSTADGSSLVEEHLVQSIAGGASLAVSTQGTADGTSLASTVCSEGRATAARSASVEKTREARCAGMRGRRAECHAPPLVLPPSTVARPAELTAALQRLWQDAAREPLFADIFTLREVLHGTRCNWSPGVGRRLGSGPRATFRVDRAALRGATQPVVHTPAAPQTHATTAQDDATTPSARNQSWTYLYILQHRHRTSVCVSCQHFDKGALVVADGDMGVEMGLVEEVVTRSQYEAMPVAERVMMGLHRLASSESCECAFSATPASQLPPSPHARVYRAANAAETALYQRTLPQLAEQTLLYLRSLQREHDFVTCRIDLMHFVGCEFQADLQKLYVYYHSPRPVRFLELATRLNHFFHCRIWIHEVASAREGEQTK